MRKQELERAWEKRVQAIGEFVEALDNGRGCGGLEEGLITSVQAHLERPDEAGVLLVIKARTGQGKFISFVGGRTLAEAVLTWRQKDMARRMKWREDTPWSSREE